MENKFQTDLHPRGLLTVHPTSVSESLTEWLQAKDSPTSLLCSRLSTSLRLCPILGSSPGGQALTPSLSALQGHLPQE